MTKQSGQSLIEVTVGLVVLVPVLLVLIDLSVIMYGVQMNDSACHNAAQSAASGEPADAEQRAQAVIDHVNSGAVGQLVSNFALVPPVDVRIDSQPEPEKDSITGKMVNAGGPINGVATVTTSVEIRPFIVYTIYGGRLPLRFTSKQSFPIHYVLPPTWLGKGQQQ